MDGETSGKGKSLFGEIAVSKAYIDRKELERALAEQQKLAETGSKFFLGQILVNRGDLVPKQVESILDIQKELILRGMANPEILSGEKGRQVIDAAYKRIFLRRALAIGLPSLIIVILMGIIYYQSLENSENDKVASSPSFDLPQSLPFGDYGDYQNVTSYSEISSSAPTIARSVPKDPEDLVVAILDPHLVQDQRDIYLKRCTQVPSELLIPLFEKHILLLDVNDFWFYPSIADFLLKIDSNRARAWVQELLSTQDNQELGFLLFSRIIRTFKNVQDVQGILLEGLRNQDPFIQEKTIYCISMTPGALTPEIQKALKEKLKDKSLPKIRVEALKVLIDREVLSEGEVFSFLKLDSPEKMKNAIIRMTLKNGIDEKIAHLIIEANKDKETKILLIRNFAHYTSEKGELYLLQALNNAGMNLKLEILNSLASYRSKRVQRTFIEQFKEGPIVQAVSIRALRKITGKNFNYQFGASLSKNTYAIDRWKRYIHSGE